MTVKLEFVARGNLHRGYTGVVVLDGKEVLRCGHRHPQTKDARACATDKWLERQS